MGGEANQEVIDDLVKEIDTNNDGIISKKEFAKLLKKHFI
jgi:Ca2+-binding EF-hand superfamily protein